MNRDRGTGNFKLIICYPIAITIYGLIREKERFLALGECTKIYPKSIPILKNLSKFEKSVFVNKKPLLEYIIKTSVSLKIS